MAVDEGGLSALIRMNILHFLEGTAPLLLIYNRKGYNTRADKTDSYHYIMSYYFAKVRSLEPIPGYLCTKYYPDPYPIPKFPSRTIH